MQRCTAKPESNDKEQLVLLRRLLCRISARPRMRRLAPALIKALDDGQVEAGVVRPETQEPVLMLTVPPEQATRLLAITSADPVAWALLKMLIERKLCIAPLDGSENDVAFGSFGLSPEELEWT